MRYPTDEELEKVKKWEITGKPKAFSALMTYINEIADWYRFEQKGNAYFLSTGGWSGNEDVIMAMMENMVFWFIYHYRTTRGGHYIFAPAGYSLEDE